MIPSARLRLTLTYIIIIMAWSVGFSIFVYRESVREFDDGLSSQAIAIRSVPVTALYSARFDNIRHDARLAFRQHLLFRLAAINVFVLCVGGGLSYFLAKRSLEPLEEAIESQARFTSDAAHELRTPLTAMKTEIEVALRNGDISKKEANELLESNLEEIAKLDTLTTALLRLARAGNGNDNASWKQLALALVASEAVSRVKAEAERRAITISKKVDGSLKVTGDKDQLVELVVILLDNAIKYGRPDTKITITASVVGSHVKLAVADQGIGIKQSEIDHIFERFYRADQSRTKNDAGGYGLGLSLADQIAKQHKGSIAVSSKENVGSTFTVNLPKSTGSKSPA